MSIVELLDRVMIASLSSRLLRSLQRSGVESKESRPRILKVQWGGADGWNNNCISLFIEGGLSYFDPGPDGTVIATPTWKDLAEFLWHGKFME